MSPGRSGSHSTGSGSSVTLFSNSPCVWLCDSGGVSPVANATAHWIAVREWSLPVSIVYSLKSGLSACTSCQKQPRRFPSDVPMAGIDRPLFSSSDSAPTSDGPKSETMTSIWG